MVHLQSGPSLTRHRVLSRRRPAACGRDEVGARDSRAAQARGRTRVLAAAAVLAALAFAAPAAVPQVAAATSVDSAAFAPAPIFESGPVNALLLSPDGSRLYALNTPDARVEIYATVPAGGAGGGVVPAGAGGQRAHSAGVGSKAPPGPPATPSLQFLGAVFTGLEPVAMALHPADANLLFVSNHVSDSVSVVDLAKQQVVATIAVGDEPQGLVIAAGRLFVACARAPHVPLAVGQLDPGPLDEHVVVVTQAAPPYAPVGNLPLGAVRPRDVVAVGGTVYAIPQNSGNHTTLIDETVTISGLGLEQLVADAFDVPVP